MIYAKHRKYSNTGRSLWTAKWLLTQRNSALLWYWSQNSGGKIIDKQTEKTDSKKTAWVKRISYMCQTIIVVKKLYRQKIETSKLFWVPQVKVMCLNINSY